MTKLMILPSLALLLAGVACGTKEAPKGPDLPVATVRLAAHQDATSEGWVAATLTATQRATLATRLAAAVKKVHVTEGQQVAAGALLVSLSDDDLQGGLKAAETAVGTAMAHARRIENLAKQGAAIPAEMDLAQVQLAQAQAGLAAVRANIGYTQIRAPFAGVVQTRRVNDGDFVGPGMPLVELEGQGALEFQGSVSEAEAKGLKLGQTLPFEINGRMGQVRITGLSTGADPVSHRGALRARIVKGGEGLRSGSFGRIQLPAGSAPSQELFVPKSAIVRRGELNGVFVARNGKAELRWLNLGDAVGDRYVVRAGLTKGESVIDTPGDLRDGQPVQVGKS